MTLTLPRPLFVCLLGIAVMALPGWWLIPGVMLVGMAVYMD